jgi:hypothetical protein
MLRLLVHKIQNFYDGDGHLDDNDHGRLIVRLMNYFYIKVTHRIIRSSSITTYKNYDVYFLGLVGQYMVKRKIRPLCLEKSFDGYGEIHSLSAD